MLNKDLIKQIIKGRSLARSLFNLELKSFSVNGTVLDIGGGVKPSYLNYLKQDVNTEIISLDFDSEAGKNIDLEKDILPYDDNSADGVLAFNILEHIYNFNFLLSEINRVLKSEGQFIGFVPFMVNYHPDPHDYFRYTKEALEKILADAGFNDILIKEIGIGPWAVNYNNVMLTWPRFFRVILFFIYYFLDRVYLKFRPGLVKRYPLGFIFTATK